MNTTDTLLEASRRVGWAKFYEEAERADAEATARRQAEAMLRVLAREIVHHDRLRCDDPLVILAKQLLSDKC